MDCTDPPIDGVRIRAQPATGISTSAIDPLCSPNSCHGFPSTTTLAAKQTPSQRPLCHFSCESTSSESRRTTQTNVLGPHTIPYPTLSWTKRGWEELPDDDLVDVVATKQCFRSILPSASHIPLRSMQLLCMVATLPRQGVHHTRVHTRDVHCIPAETG